MAKRKDGRASWFKVFLHQKALIDSVPSENVGSALKAALQYFEDGEIPEIDPLSFAVFSTFKQYIDESNEDFKKFSEAGQQGNKKRWGSHVSPPDTTISPPDTGYHEAEAEALSTMHYAEANTKSIGADKPPAPAKKVFSEYGWVKLTQDEYDRLVADLGEVEVKRCIAYVDESAQTTNNKNKWRDWNLVVRKCSREGWGLNGYKREEKRNGKTESQPLWTVGTTV